MYKEFYGFTEEPFGLGPNPGFLFLTENHKKILDSLLDGVNNRKGFILLTGERGVGKTTLIRHFISLLGEKVKALELSRNFETVEEILETILRELGLPVAEPSKSRMGAQLGEYLNQKAAVDEILVIVIDNAQDLSKEILEELRLLAGQDPRRPRVLQELFVGDSPIEEIMGSEGMRQLGQRIEVKCALEPLNEMESRQYIESRLSGVGSESSKVFTPEALDLLCRYGKGIPQVINMICYLALSTGYALSKKKVDSTAVEDIVSILYREKAGREPRGESPIRALADAFGKSPRIMKVSYILLAYSFISGIIFYFFGRE
jgi:general secretion pathway protein A